MNNNELKKLITNDQVGNPDEAIKARLNQTFMLKSANYKVRQNSFAGMFIWLFSVKSFGIKTALAGILIAFFMFNQNVSITPATNIATDSTSVYQTIEIDTSLFLPNAKSVTDSVLL